MSYDREYANWYVKCPNEGVYFDIYKYTNPPYEQPPVLSEVDLNFYNAELLVNIDYDSHFPLSNTVLESVYKFFKDRFDVLVTGYSILHSDDVTFRREFNSDGKVISRCLDWLEALPIKAIDELHKQAEDCGMFFIED